MHFKIYLFTLSLILFKYDYLSGQKRTIKFGKPSIEELEMSICSFDTAASAMILYRKGLYYGPNDEFIETIRIKILGKDGIDNGQFTSILFDNPKIEAYSFNLVDGNIEESKLKNESIFITRIDKHTLKVSFAMPNVREGTVMDIKIIYSGHPVNWYFQDNIPSAYCELEVEQPRSFGFRQTFYGNLSLNKLNSNKWAMENVPAYIPEPFIDSEENYRSKIEFEDISVNNYNFPQPYSNSANRVIDFSTNWTSLNDFLKTSKYFGEAIGYGLYLNSAAKIIAQKSNSEEEKIKSAVRYIKQIKWNGDKELFISKTNLQEVFKDKIGNAAEINLILMLLLKKLDLDARPVILSTIENGLLSRQSPNLNRINYLVVQLRKVDGTFIYLDATHPNLPYNLIPSYCFNHNGVRILSEAPEFHEINPIAGLQKTAFYKLKLNDDLSFSGSIKYNRQDYSGYNFRSDYLNFNSIDEFISDVKSKKKGLIIEKHNLVNLDSADLPMKDEYEVKIIDKSEEIGNELYFNPMFFEGMKENYFKQDKRLNPVDFILNQKDAYTLMLSIPESYAIQSKPSDLSLKTPDKGAHFTYQITQNGNSLILNYKLNITKRRFEPEEYFYLKEFIDRVVKKCQEPIILKKL